MSISFPFSFWKKSGFKFLPNPTGGPFSDLSTPLVSSLSPLTISTNQGFGEPLNYRSNPLKYSTVTINNAGSLTVSLLSGVGYNGTVWLWCDQLILNGSITANGQPGGNGFLAAISTSQGGAGGNGMSGGGGGAAADAASVPVSGGTGSTGVNGAGANPSDENPGAGGTGSGNTILSGCPYTFQSGGAGGSSSLGTAGGAGAAGIGGGGAGGESVSSPDPGSNPVAAGAGGGGGSLICIVANMVIGTGSLSSKGGSGGNSSYPGSGNSSGGGGGGGGAITIFAVKYTNGLSFNVTKGSGLEGSNNGVNGNYRLVEIAHDQLTTLNTYNNTGASWNHT